MCSTDQHQLYKKDQFEYLCPIVPCLFHVYLYEPNQTDLVEKYQNCLSKTCSSFSYDVPSVCVFISPPPTGTAWPSVSWTVALVSLQVLPSSQSWASCLMSRTCPFQKWLNLVRFWIIFSLKTFFFLKKSPHNEILIQLLMRIVPVVRSRFGLYSLSSCCVHDAFLPFMGLLLLHHDRLSGAGQSSETNICTTEIEKCWFLRLLQV